MHGLDVAQPPVRIESARQRCCDWLVSRMLWTKSGIPVPSLGGMIPETQPRRDQPQQMDSFSACKDLHITRRYQALGLGTA